MKPALFDRIRRQYLGQVAVSTDNRESSAMGLGKSLLRFGEIHDARFTTEQIMALTAEQVRTMAERILTSGLSRLTIDPLNP